MLNSTSNILRIPTIRTASLFRWQMYEQLLVENQHHITALYQIDCNRPRNALLRRVGTERLIQPFAQLDEQGQ